MCEYCDMTLTREVDEIYLRHKPLHLRDGQNNHRIKANGKFPIMYLKECVAGGRTWELVCEFNDTDKTVVKTPIKYCPVCGERVKGRKIK